MAEKQIRKLTKFQSMKVLENETTKATFGNIESRRKINSQISERLESLSGWLGTKNRRILSDNISRLISRSDTLFSDTERLIKQGKKKEADLAFKRGAEIQKAAIHAATALSESIAASGRNPEKVEKTLKALAKVPASVFEAAVLFETVALYSIGQPWAAAAIAAAPMLVFSKETREALGMAPIGKADYVFVAASFMPIGRIPKVSYTTGEVKLLGSMYRLIAKAVDAAHSLTPKAAESAIKEALDACESIAKLGGKQAVEGFQTFRKGIEESLRYNPGAALAKLQDEFLIPLEKGFSKAAGVPEKTVKDMLMKGRMDDLAKIVSRK